MESLVDKYCFILNNAGILDKHCKQTLKEVGYSIDELYSETHEFLLQRGEGCNFCKKENSMTIELNSDELANIYEGLGDRRRFLKHSIPVGECSQEYIDKHIIVVEELIPRIMDAFLLSLGAIKIMEKD